MKKNIVILGICLSLLTSCSSPAKNLVQTVKDAADSVQSTSTPEPTGTPAPKESKLALGAKGTVGDWKICVKKAEVKSQIKNGSYHVFEPDKGDRFVTVTATIRNNGKEESTFLPRIGYKGKMLTATLYYKDEYEYQPLELLSYDKDLVELKVKPLTSKTGIITFDVPKKVANAKGKGNLTLKIGTDSESLIYTLK